MSDKDYDRRYMRGRLKITLNEGFKRLFGFDHKSYKKSKWACLDPILKQFPDSIQKQYQEVSSHLKSYSKLSWWKEDRDTEVHLDVEKLYDFRIIEINESKVIMEFMKLFNALMAVNGFLNNAHTCILNSQINWYNNRKAD